VEFIPRELGWWGIRIPNSLLANLTLELWRVALSHARPVKPH
jgi:hypothetical protein